MLYLFLIHVKKIVLVFFLIISFCSAYTQDKFVRICISVKSSSINSFPAQLVINTTKNNVYFNNSIYKDTCITFYGNDSIEYSAVAQMNGYVSQSIKWKFDTLKTVTITLDLSQRIITLKDINIKGNNGIRMSGDTMIIPVNKIQTKPHSNATDLIENVPGMSVSENGKVHAMGKTVNQITVDGKELFGGNPKAVLESVKSDMIQQLEIFNEGSSMNLRLKKNKQNGIYGEAGIVAGTNNRFSSNARINTIKPSAINNLFINFNNTNERAYTLVDLFKTFNAGLIADETGLLTKKLYYTPSLLQTPEMNDLQNFATLTKGIRKSVSGGFNSTKTLKNAEWKTYGLFYRDNTDITDNKLSEQFYTPLIQQKNDSESTKNKPALAIFESKLDLHPNDNNKIQVKLGGSYQSDNNAISLTSNSNLISSNSVLQSTFLFNNQYNKGRQWQGSAGVNWEHRYQKPAEKTTMQFDFAYFAEKNENAYENNLFANGDSALSNNNFVSSRGNQSSIAFRVEHSTPLNSFLLFDVNVGVVANNYIFSQQGFGINDNEKILNSSMAVKNIGIGNTQSYAQAFLFFKKSKFSAILGLGALASTYKSKKEDSLINNNNVVIALPHIYAEYKFSDRTKFSFTHKIEQINPDLQNVISLPDSSNINLITKGNLYLAPYKENIWQLNMNYLSKRIGQFGLSVEYDKNDHPIVSDNIFDPNLFITQTFTNYRSSGQWNGYLSWFFFRSQTKGLDPYVFLFFINNDGYILNQNKESAFNVNNAVITSGFKWKIAAYQSLDFSLQQKYSFSEQANNDRFFLDLKSENRVSIL